MDLNQVQKLMGSVNDIAQMCPMLKHHKRAGNCFMATFGGDPEILKRVPAKMREDCHCESGGKLQRGVANSREVWKTRTECPMFFLRRCWSKIHSSEWEEDFP